MVLTRVEARALGHDYIGTEHLILGLMLEGDDVAAKVLSTLGADTRKVRSEVEKCVKRGTSPPSGNWLPFTPRMKRVFEYALEEAESLENVQIGTAHLLLGLIREDRGPGFQVLHRLGISADAVRVEVQNQLAAESLVGILPAAPEEEARALVEAILLKRLHHSVPKPRVPGSVELEVRSVQGPKGCGFQLWLGHRNPVGDLKTEMALWVDRATTLEEQFAPILVLFEGLVGSEGGEGPQPPGAA
jgi:hypothetical protein